MKSIKNMKIHFNRNRKENQFKSKVLVSHIKQKVLCWKYEQDKYFKNVMFSFRGMKRSLPENYFYEIRAYLVDCLFLMLRLTLFLSRT